MKKGVKRLLSVILVIIILLLGYLAFISGDAVYNLPIFQKKIENDLQEKNILFLGSSVTKGYGTFNVSFVDYLDKVYSINTVKKSVNGTTLIDNGKKSYVSRLKKIDKATEIDMLICQLSTNDASKNSPLGSVSEGFDIESFDTSTVAGAIEYIIAYSRQTFNCKVGFYTSTKYDSEQYDEMCKLLNEISRKWDVPVLDLWNNGDFANCPWNHRVDEKHPTMLCYREDVTPLFYEFIKENI